MQVRVGGMLTKSSLVPVLGNIGEIVSHDRPDNVGCVGGVPIFLNWVSNAKGNRVEVRTISHWPKEIKAVARKAGPSRCGRPQEPVKAVSSALNLGSPNPPPPERLPDGFDTVWIYACELIYCSISSNKALSPFLNISTRFLNTKAESRLQV